jgi:hypothetical protein
VTHRTIDDLDHEELATLVKEHLLAGHLIDRSGMPLVTHHGVDVMRDIAIDEWMGASPVYTKRTQRLLGFEGDTVEACFKAMQLEIGAPPEFMDFRYTVIDDHHGLFHLDHCGALMDVEPMGDEFVVAMCHHIEDPTFDATGWATNPRLRMRPIHRPPRVPTDRHPHCSWTVTIDPAFEPTPEPPPLARIAASRAASLPLAVIEAPAGDADGMLDYTKPLDADLHLRDFATEVLRAFDDEVCLQGHLLTLSFIAAVEDRFGTEEAVICGARQMVGVAGVAAERLKRAFGLGATADDLATVCSLHPAFRPPSYVSWQVTVIDDAVNLELGPCPGQEEQGLESWITLLADGHDRALSAIATAVDPHWAVRSDGPGRWVVERGEEPTEEMSEVVLTKFSTGVAFGFDR